MAINKVEIVGGGLSHFAKVSPQKEAAIHGELRLSYSDLQDKVNLIAKVLIAEGVDAGDHVGLMGPPNLNFYLIYLATVSIGGIWFGLNPRYQEPEYKYLLHDTQANIYASLPPTAVQAIKQSINAYSGVLSDAIMHMDSDQFIVLQKSEDAAESLRAHKEKRAGKYPPKLKGQTK